MAYQADQYESLATAIDLLSIAETVLKERGESYGPPQENFKLIAALWAAYTGIEVTAQDVANMMILLKISRLRSNPEFDDGTSDSVLDLIGYSALKAVLSD